MPRPSAIPPAASTGIVHRVHHRREEGQERPTTAVTTRLGALRHDSVGREGRGLASRLERLDLQQQPGPRAPDRVDERRRVAEGEHDRGRDARPAPPPAVGARARSQVMKPMPIRAPSAA